MADDPKINPSSETKLPTASDSFLSLPVERSVKQTDYLIEEEFRKTRKNKSPLTILLLLFVASLLGLGSYLLSLNVEQHNKELQTDIRDFQNIQLREVLNIVSQIRSSIAQMEERRMILEQEMGDATTVLDGNYQERLSFLEGTEEEIIEQRASLQRANRREISVLRAEYEEEFTRIDEEIRVLRSELSQYDDGISTQVTERQGAGSNQLRELEIRRLTESYESRIASIRTLYQDQLGNKDQVLRMVENRYNPVFNDAALQELLVTDPEILPIFPNTEVYDVVKEHYANVWEYYQYTEILIKRLQKIPYQGDVAQSLQSIEFYRSELIRSYEDIVRELSYRLSDMEKLALQYRYSFDSFTSQFREDGIVLDARNPERVLIYLNSFAQARPGQTLYVFRGEALSAVLTLLPKSETGQYYAYLSQEIIPDPIQAYDRILLQIETTATGEEPSGESAEKLSVSSERERKNDEE